MSYAVNNIYGLLQIARSGDDFFSEVYSNIPQVVHKSDWEQMTEFMSRDRMISALENHKDCSISYRIMVSGKPSTPGFLPAKPVTEHTLSSVLRISMMR